MALVYFHAYSYGAQAGRSGAAELQHKAFVMRPFFLAMVLVFAAVASISAGETEELLKQAQGRWEREVTETPDPNDRMVKEIEGNTETFSIYHGGKLTYQQKVDFDIEVRDGVAVFILRNVRVTAGPGTGREGSGQFSYLFKIRDGKWIEVQGLMIGDEATPKLSIYERVDENEPKGRLSAREQLLKQAQGRWEREVTETPDPTDRMVKEIEGNRETFSIFRDDRLVYQHTVDFEINALDHVNVFTFRNLKVTTGAQAGQAREGTFSYLFQIRDGHWIEGQGLMNDDEAAPNVTVYQRADAKSRSKSSDHRRG